MIKIFEEYNNKPEVGDYVLINYKIKYDKDFESFINNNIGKLFEVDFKFNEIEVEYENVPENIKKIWFYNNTVVFNISDIVEYGKTIEELELKLAINKYNL
jgi:hypothetical protein